MFYSKKRNRVRENERIKSIYNIFSKLGEGICIVEGKHDIKALHYAEELFGVEIQTITYNSFINNGHKLKDFNKVFILTDEDYGGKIKKKAILAKLDMMNTQQHVDTETGRRLLNILGVKCIEQIKEPLLNVLGIGRRRRSRNNKKHVANR